MPDNPLTSVQVEAAELIAEGRLSDTQIAEKCGVARQTLWVWRQKPEFEASVAGFIDVINRTIRRRAISHAERRIDRLNADWLRLRRVIEERAEDPAVQNVAGGKTGLMVRTQKILGSGPAAEVVEEFAVDVAVLKELRDIEKQAAQELGQWTERTSVDATVKSYDTANSPDEL